MTSQPELALENKLVKQLIESGYQSVSVTNETELVANLKTQLERFNHTTYSESEFHQILNHHTKHPIQVRKLNCYLINFYSKMITTKQYM